ncbi:threonylcarbamoyl-AMP synthase [candidate division WWE3 bacterium]|uniref:L-threonylcarbamoyladenylate synthase n=1 Tax=candidate division WWE3 bacterium TaxID=2053526 RepID=A0A7X9DJU4_UNCKA|nr:threonylcarbamoyl-AMP synthase [candidate division WWE3 bacterium]
MKKPVVFQQENLPQIAEKILKGQVGMIPSDTLYGFSCDALNIGAVEKIYSLKKRETTKPFIVLIDKIDSLSNLNIVISEKQKMFLQNNWPNPLTVVLNCPEENLTYIHRKKNSIGFRLPNNEWLRKLLKQTGPLISTTVNLAGEPPINTVEEAIKEFGSNVDFYVDAGPLESPPSTVISLAGDGTIKVHRQGIINVKENYI